MDRLVLILTLVRAAAIANPVAKGGGKSSSKSSDKSSGTQSVSINSNIPSSTTTAIYYGNNNRCYRDYLHAIEIPCPHHRLSKGATAGITAGCILAGQLIDVLIRMLIAIPPYSVVGSGILLQREDHGVHQAEERSEGARGFCDGATEQGGFLGVSGMVLDVVFVRDILFFPSMNPHQYLVHEKSSVSARCR
ncbi:hypothetical protein EDD85DRAFT_855056 [Armillaria nabsnona]|nr:hypothetical protein EDD85DRAFT_855056 [Armillaria nabsnona]